MDNDNEFGDASMRRIAALRAVIFDMDGLLLDSESLALDAIRAAGRELGLDVSPELRRSMIGVPADTCQAILDRHFEGRVSSTELLAQAAVHLDAAVEAGRLRLRPGVTQVLAWLDRTGTPRAIATSSSARRARRHLAAAGIAGRFDAIVTRDDVSRSKPHPDPYLLAASLLQAPPAECLVLEDSHNGVRAAAGAGMPVIMVPDQLEPTAEMHELCIAVLPSLSLVLPMLESWQALGTLHPPQRSRPPAT